MPTISVVILDYLLSIVYNLTMKILTIFIISIISTATAAYTISGISSGGFMAQQMATIYSQSIEGVATVAGGYYYCALDYLPKKVEQDKKTIGEQNLFLYEPSNKALSDSLNPLVIFSGEINPVTWFKPSIGNPIYQAVSECMLNPDHTKINYSYIKKNVEKNLIDHTDNIKDQKVLIFHGKKDSVLDIKMQNKLLSFYQHFNLPKENLKVIKGKGSHNFPISEKKGIDCDKEDVPYLGNCQYDLAYEILSHLNQITADKSDINEDNLYMIDQTISKENINRGMKTFKQPSNSIAPYGYLYASEACLNNPESCRLHVALHGCKMSDSYNDEFQQSYQTQVQNTKDLHVKTKSRNRLLGKVSITDKTNRFGLLKFVLDSDYLKYAEKNHLMILFPQTWITEKNFPYNPKGCWDWFGWTTEQYATNQGIETKWMHAWIKNVSVNPKEFLINERPHIKEMRDFFN